MRSWLGSSLLSVGLLASGCADSPASQQSAYNPGSASDTTAGTQTGGEMPGNGSANPAMDGGTKPVSQEMEDAGSAEDDGKTDAGAVGPQCNVAKDATRGFHCTYINRIATGILAPADSGLPAIQGCKDFPADVSQGDVTTACEDIFPALEGSIMVSAGPCDLTNAKGYCSDIFGGRDFAYHANCDIADSAGGSGSWACDKVVPDEAGWTCLIDESKSWDRGCLNPGDAGMTDAGNNGNVCAVPADGDGKTYRCDYVNEFASDATSDKHDVVGCKEYRGTWTKSAAQDDCSKLTQADKSKPRTLSEASCPIEADGYCPNTRGDREYAYEGGCSGNNSGAWACANVTACAQAWVCLGEPDRRCVDKTPSSGEVSCTDLPFNTTAEAAGALCPGHTVELGKCSTTGAIASCTLASGSVQVFSTGSCFDARESCKDTFKCLVEQPVYSCHKVDNGLGCTSIIPFGCATPTWCVDYRQADGWTESSAAARCTLDQANPNNGGTANVVSTFKKTTAESCAMARPETTRCVVAVDAKSTLRYGEPSCSGTSEPVPPTVCENSGVISCRYSSTFTASNCADFQTSECWTEAQVQTHCAAQQGAQANTVVVSKGNTCLAATPTADRCAAESAGKTWYAYGTPSNICTSFIENGKFETAPYAPY